MKSLYHHNWLLLLLAKGSKAQHRSPQHPACFTPTVVLRLLISIAIVTMVHDSYSQPRRDADAKITPSLDTWKTICKKDLHKQPSQGAQWQRGVYAHRRPVLDSRLFLSSRAVRNML